MPSEQPRHVICGMNLLSQKWLEKVVGTPENDLRGHRVGLTYSVLAGYLDDLINGEDSVYNTLKRKGQVKVCNANWFHFATWATVTVTRNIASERPPQRIDTLPLAALRRRLTPALIQMRASSGQRVGRALSWGQRLIFASLCFALEYLDTWLTKHADDDPETFSMLDEDELRSRTEEIIDLGRWGKDEWIHEERHIEAITEAFRFYMHARTTDDPLVRARCILGGNILLTAVEQDLINSAVGTVINHIPETVASALDQRIAAWAERWMNVPRQLTSLQLPFRYVPAREAFDTAWSRLMTDQVLVMTLPTETLRLGRDIPWRRAGQPYYPRELQRLESDTERADTLKEVADLVHSFDRTVGDGHGSAARDWRRWDERMNWAVTLLRSRQQDETLFWMPYSTEDQESIVKGRLPRRAGDPSALEVQPPLGNELFPVFLQRAHFGR